MKTTITASLSDPLGLAIALVTTVGLGAMGRPWLVAIAAGLAVLAIHAGSAYWFARRRQAPKVAETPAALWRDLGLTRKEIEVMPLILSGLSYREVAERTFNSERTIENHVDHIKKKLDVHSKDEIIAFAARRGVIGPGDPRGTLEHRK